MDDLFGILMVLIFILAPIIEGLKRKEKQQQQRPDRKLPDRGRTLPPVQSSRTEELARPREPETAADLVPDDLWEILTGQKRMPQPVPEQRPQQPWDVVYEPDVEEADEDEEELYQEAVSLEDIDYPARRDRERAVSLERYEPHAQPVVVSLEQKLPSTPQRHRAFHERKLTAPAQVTRKAKTPLQQALDSRSELQRAFVLMEVLGKPKGLE